jgi:hypothetical protein
MARNAGHFPQFLIIDLRDQTGWLGREDSNLRMAESKSVAFEGYLIDTSLSINLKLQAQFQKRPPKAAVFISQMMLSRTKQYQVVTEGVGSSTRHDCDMMSTRAAAASYLSKSASTALPIFTCGAT